MSMHGGESSVLASEGACEFSPRHFVYEPSDRYGLEELQEKAVLYSERYHRPTDVSNEPLVQLLQEKEHHLRLAAEIGRSLLEQNNDLQEQITDLKEELRRANDKVSQLRHEITLREELYQLCSKEEEDNDNSSAAQSSNGNQKSSGNHLAPSNADSLQKKLANTESENVRLKDELEQALADVEYWEKRCNEVEHEQTKKWQLTSVVIKELEANCATKGEIVGKQQEEITSLVEKVDELSARVSELSVKNNELQENLDATSTRERKLSSQLTDVVNKWDNYAEMLHEARREVKLLRRDRRTGVVQRHHFSAMLTPYIANESLAFELEDSFRRDHLFGGELSQKERRKRNRRVFETARCVRGTLDSHRSLRKSLEYSDAESLSDGYICDTESLYSYQVSLGRPGIPGSNDLETALNRLAANTSSNSSALVKRPPFFKPALQQQSLRECSDRSDTPTPCRTPESVTSLDDVSYASDWSMRSFALGISRDSSRLRDKLIIVKPMEGSLTLLHWRRLATPHLGCILEQRPGIQVKGSHLLDEEEEEFLYSLSDVEEDDSNDIPPSLARPFLALSAPPSTNPNTFHSITSPPTSNRLSCSLSSPSSAYSSTHFKNDMTSFKHKSAATNRNILVRQSNISPWKLAEELSYGRESSEENLEKLEPYPISKEHSNRRGVGLLSIYKGIAEVGLNAALYLTANLRKQPAAFNRPDLCHLPAVSDDDVADDEVTVKLVDVIKSEGTGREFMNSGPQELSLGHVECSRVTVPARVLAKI